MTKTILAIDTATEACSVALLYKGETTSIFELCPQQHSQKILPFIEQLLDAKNLKPAQLDAIAYGAGPGSFTGVRISASTVQGLSFAHDIPVVGISTLSAMAHENYVVHDQAESLVMIDARMQEVYFAYKRCSEGGKVDDLLGEQVLPPDKLPITLSEFTERQLIGTGVVAYEQILTTKNLPSNPNVLYPNAKYMLPLALEALAVGSYGSANDVSPTYIRDRVTWKKLPGK